MKINQKSKTFQIFGVKSLWPQFLNPPDLLWRIWKLWPHWFALKNLKGLALLINFHRCLLTIGPKLDFWRIFENFGLVLKIHTLGLFWAFENLTFTRLLAAVPTFALAHKACPILSVEDIKGFQKSDIGNHGNDWPWQKVVHKMEPLVFLGRRKYNLYKIRCFFHVIYKAFLFLHCLHGIIHTC